MDVYYGDHWNNEHGGRIHSTKKDERGTLEFLRKRSADKPFLLEVCRFGPHSVDHTRRNNISLKKRVCHCMKTKHVENDALVLWEHERGKAPLEDSLGHTRKTPARMMKNYISEIDKTSEVSLTRN